MKLLFLLLFAKLLNFARESSRASTRHIRWRHVVKEFVRPSSKRILLFVKCFARRVKSVNEYVWFQHWFQNDIPPPIFVVSQKQTRRPRTFQILTFAFPIIASLSPVGCCRHVGQHATAATLLWSIIVPFAFNKAFFRNSLLMTNITNNSGWPIASKRLLTATSAWLTTTWHFTEKTTRYYCSAAFSSIAR